MWSLKLYCDTRTDAHTYTQTHIYIYIYYNNSHINRGNQFIHIAPIEITYYNTK